MEFEQELRAASDELMRRLERLRELEIEKRQLTPGTARFRKLARDIERLAAGVLTKTVEQEHLADKSIELREQTGAQPQPIAEVRPQRDISLILGEWREAERRLSAAEPGTPSHLEAQSAVQRLRTEYRDAYLNAASTTSNGR